MFCIRYLTALLFSLFFTGCQTISPPPDLASDADIMIDATSPTLDTHSAIMDDGVILPVDIWSAQQPQAIILALHGFNDYAQAFAMPAPYWQAQGITTIAYDQRGFGRHESPGRWVGTDRMVQDARIMIDLVAQSYPDIPLYVLGESMGGAVVMLALQDSDTRAHTQSAIFVAPAFWARYNMPFYQQAGLWFAEHFLFWLDHLDASGLDITPSDNIEMLRALSQDPLVLSTSSMTTLSGLVDLMDAAQRAVPDFHHPRSLFLYGQHEEVLPLQDMIENLRSLPWRRHVFAYYPTGYHMLLRDLGARHVWEDIAAWITDQPDILPSTMNITGQNLLEK